MTIDEEKDLPARQLLAPGADRADNERAEALLAYEILDTPSEPEFEDIVRLAAETFNAPIAVINLVASDRQWFKAEIGIGVRQMPLDVSICVHALLENDFMVVPDTRQDARFASNPLVTAEGGLRFYAGAILRSATGVPIGTVCVLDREPRPDGATAHQRLVLEVLARQVITQFELRRALIEQGHKAEELARTILERGVAQDSLGRIEERYRLVGRATNDAVWDWGLISNHVTWNEALETRFGYAPSDVAPTGDWWIGHIHPDDQKRIQDGIHAAIDSDANSWSDGYRFRRADGSYAIILDRGHIIRDETGKARRMIGAMLDLTEGEEARAALQISEERLRLATEAAEVGFWDVEVVNEVLIWPPIVKRMFGISADVPVTLQDFYDGLHPDDHHATDEALKAACDPVKRALYDVEYRTIGREDGLVRWIAAKGRGLFDAEGICLRIVGTAIDVTQRKLADAQLRQSEDRLRFLRNLDEALQAATDARAAMMAAAERLALRLDASRCAYADVDADSNRFIIRDDWVAPGVKSSAGVYSLDLFGSRAVADMLGGSTLIVRDVGAELAPADGRDMFQSIGINAIICCPLVKDERLVAMMAVHQNVARDWQEDEVQLVEAVVERCWAHVQRIGAEQRLRDSETRYRTLFEAVDVGFTIAEIKFDELGKAIDYRLKEMNPAFERQTGMAGLTGKWIREAVPGLEEHWFELYGQVAATGQAVRFENYAEPMGRWFDVHAFRTGEAEEKLVAILFNDITARKRGEEALKNLNDHLEEQVAERTAELRFNRDIIEASLSPICAFDTAFRLIAFNKAHNDEFRRVNGFETRIGDCFPELFLPEQSEQMRAFMARALSGEAFTVVEEFGRPEYDQPHWEITYTPLRDADGKIIGAFHLANDISDRLRAEQELDNAQEALRQSQKMEAMGSLTGGVAHDFNNLLTPIIGSLDMLQRKGIGGEREQRLIGGALQSAERAKTLVQRLLAFARRQPLQTRAVDVAKLVRGMVDLISSTLGPQIKIFCNLPVDLPAALVDDNQLEMAILNLSVNARDAMPEGGRLTISAQNADVGHRNTLGLRPGCYIHLSVADTGTGMDEDTLRRAVEPFYSTKGIGKGTGLGLSMVHGLAAQLGGALFIESRLGSGTDVQLWLPTTRETVLEADEVSENSPNAGAGCALLVDDDEMVRATTADMLSELGYDVIEAESAEQALSLVAAGLKPILLVTDHLMPGKNGTDLARDILQQLPGIRILIVSGYAEFEGIALDLPRLVKPFRQSDLATILSDQ
jgi:PAS domain S-box-containing protein